MSPLAWIAAAISGLACAAFLGLAALLAVNVVYVRATATEQEAIVMGSVSGDDGMSRAMGIRSQALRLKYDLPDGDYTRIILTVPPEIYEEYRNADRIPAYVAKDGRLWLLDGTGRPGFTLSIVLVLLALVPGFVFAVGVVVARRLAPPTPA